MNIDEWVYIKPDQYALIRAGLGPNDPAAVKIEQMVSPYDIPLAYRGVVKGKFFAIELKYIDDDTKFRDFDEDGLQISVGNKNFRIYEIRFPLDRKKPTADETLSLYISALKDLIKEHNSKKEEKSNYDVIEHLIGDEYNKILPMLKKSYRSHS